MGKFEGYLIASDFDGTLCRGEIKKKDIEALRYFGEEGGRFGVITGRGYGGVFPCISENLIGAAHFYSCANGAQGFLADGTPIFETKAEVALAAELYRFIRDFAREKNDSFYIGFVSGEKGFSLGERDEDGKTFIDDLLYLEYYNQINVGCHSADQARELRDRVSERFSGRLTPLQNGGSVDMPVGNTTKATGASMAAKYFGVPEKNVFTVGDNYNDLDMIKAFNGCAVENAVDELKSAAICVVPDVAGVVEYIEKNRAI